MKKKNVPEGSTIVGIGEVTTAGSPWWSKVMEGTSELL